MLVMWCKECARCTRSKVLDTRAWPTKVWRRRECLECSARFTTTEVTEHIVRPPRPDLARIKQMRAERMTYKAIAKTLGVSLNKVWRMDNGI